MVNLLLLLPKHQVFKKVNCNLVALGEVSLHIDAEELVDLPLGAELGREGGGSDCGSSLTTCLHAGYLFYFQLY